MSCHAVFLPCLVLMALVSGGLAAAAEPVPFEYAPDGAFKPYVKRLLSPGGVNVLRDQVPDHLHHHGLMFAVGVDGVDFWSETPTCGRQVRRVPAGANAPAANPAGVIAETIDWLPPGDAKPLARESRRIEVRAAPAGGATLLSWRTALEPAEGRASIKLAGSHYFGLGMRFPAAMDNVAEFFTAKGPVDGEVVRGDERLTRGPWCACTGAIDGKTVTVALFDSPGNPRPAWWFTMGKPFGYLSATLNLYREPLTVEAGKPLVLVYGVAVWDGKVKADQIESVYRQWLDATKAAAPEQGTK